MLKTGPFEVLVGKNIARFGDRSLIWKFFDYATLKSQLSKMRFRNVDLLLGKMT